MALELIEELIAIFDVSDKDNVVFDSPMPSLQSELTSPPSSVSVESPQRNNNTEYLNNNVALSERALAHFAQHRGSGTAGVYIHNYGIYQDTWNRHLSSRHNDAIQLFSDNVGNETNDNNNQNND